MESHEQMALPRSIQLFLCNTSFDLGGVFLKLTASNGSLSSASRSRKRSQTGRGVASGCLQAKAMFLSQGGRFLRLVAERGNVCVWESLVKALHEQLSPEQVQVVPREPHCCQSIC